MLTEQFIASVGTALSQSRTSTAVKDASILTIELQPTQSRRSAELKKSTTSMNCLALSQSHIYAAQSDKAIVNVYNREKNSLEAAIPFKEKVTCLALACEDTLLVMGTERGRLYLWETMTGRQLSTSQAHLQAMSALAIDPTSNFVLSGSLDAAIHIWSLPALVSFTPPPSGSEEHSRTSPVRTFSSHRNAITAIAMGHSTSFCNFAVSASKDNTIIIWDYYTETVLRTILLPAAPLCLALDPADRAIYTGYQDGSVQSIDLISSSRFSVADQISSEAGATLQPDPSSRWTPPSSDAAGAANTLLLSYDATKLISGHEAGKILAWDVPTGTYLSNLTTPALSGPVTNLASLPVSGFPSSGSYSISTLTSTSSAKELGFKQPAVVKPRFGEFDLANNDGSNGQVPTAYTAYLQYTRLLAPTAFDHAFQDALTHPVFPDEMLQDAIQEMKAFAHDTSKPATTMAAPTNAPTPAAPAEVSMQRDATGSRDAAAADPDGFIALRDPSSAATPNRTISSEPRERSREQDQDSPALVALSRENEQLKKQLAALRRVTKKSLEQIEEMRKGGQSGGKGGRRVESEEDNDADEADDDDAEMRDLHAAEREWDRLGRR